MRAFYLSLPEADRHLRAVADKFGCSYDKVYRAARSFNWVEDIKKRESAIRDPFPEEHQKRVKDFRMKALLLACKHLDNELIRSGVPGASVPEPIQAMIQAGAISEATKELIAYVKDLPVRAKDYKDLNNLVDLVRKIVFEWDPNETDYQGGPGGKGIQFNSYSLIIEKA